MFSHFEVALSSPSLEHVTQPALVPINTAISPRNPSLLHLLHNTIDHFKLYFPAIVPPSLDLNTTRPPYHTNNMKFFAVAIFATAVAALAIPQGDEAPWKAVQGMLHSPIYSSTQTDHASF